MRIKAVNVYNTRMYNPKHEVTLGVIYEGELAPDGVSFKIKDSSVLILLGQNMCAYGLNYEIIED